MSTGSARAALERIVARHQLRISFPEEVEREAADWVASPGIDAPDLIDLQDLPFVTIDGPHTRDLDQALYVARDGTGFAIDYAIADAAWFVRPGSALFREALARGASHYLPGLTLPMLPRTLSEGVISLNAGVPRRALVFRMRVDATGNCTHTAVVRGRVRSRKQLTFEQVSRLLAGSSSPLSGTDFEPSLRAMAEVGRLRQRLGDERGVVRFRRAEVDVQLEGDLRFVATRALPNDVERYNEQISLLANQQGASLIAAGGGADARVEPIYRVHPAPDPRRIDELERLSTELAARDPRAAHLRWDRARETLAEWLTRLPERGPGARIGLALHQQALMTSGRSAFSAEPGAHFGVGAELYARFTSPMREVVGVFLHKELFEKLDGGASADEALRTEVIDSANQAKEIDKQLTKAANELVLDELFERELRRPIDARRAFVGTVVGSNQDKLYVVLDEPPIEVKVHRRHAGPSFERVGLGDAVSLRVRGREEAPKRTWMLAL